MPESSDSVVYINVASAINIHKWNMADRNKRNAQKRRKYSAPKGIHSSHKMAEIHQRTKHWKCVLLLLLLMETTTYEAKNYFRNSISMIKMIRDFNHEFYSKNPEKPRNGLARS